MQLIHLRSWGQWPSAVVSIVSPYLLVRVHFWHSVGSIGMCSFSSCRAPHRRQRCGSLHWCEVWSSFQQFLHCMTGGRSWNARSVQWLPNAARDFWLRIWRAVDSSVSANTREDLYVESNSSSVRSQRGFATIRSWDFAYMGLHAMSSVCTLSAECVTRPFPMDKELVATPSTCILYHLLSSRMIIS